MIRRIGVTVALFCVPWGIGGCGTNRSGSNKDSIQIVKPVGLPECYLGMPIKNLGDEWRPNRAVKPEPGKSYLDNPKHGLGIEHDGEKIVGIFIYFDSDEYGKFSGKIEGGIGADTSIENVIHEKGQPANISITKGDDGEHEDLWYIEKCINYDFLNKRLSEVTIGKPNLDYPPELKEDIGDTAVYRKIRP
jgi:hypothetical protein